MKALTWFFAALVLPRWAERSAESSLALSEVI
jgi:hypothetical protein